jgi:hypothetical protein
MYGWVASPVNLLPPGGGGVGWGRVEVQAQCTIALEGIFRTNAVIYYAQVES